MTDHAALIAETRKLLGERRAADAERLLLQAVAQNNREPSLLELLAEFYTQIGRPLEVAKVLARLIELDPQSTDAYFRLAATFDQLGRPGEAVVVYTRLCSEHPELALAHFNRAHYLRRIGHLHDALDSYRRAIELGVDDAAEAWSNSGVILGELERHEEARAAFASALATDSRWVPAHYNLGILHEEFGERDAALRCFERVLEINPDYHDALAHIVQATRFTDADHPLLERIRKVLRRVDLAPTDREALAFALGKALDDCGRYDEAFEQFRAANASARARAERYDHALVERDNAAIVETFSAQWLANTTPVSTRPLVFLCGMFRSGTTLLEQMLGSHAAFRPGGELRYFNARLGDESTGFPAIITAGGQEALRELGLGYLAHLDARFPGNERVINKRPDNFRYLGLLRGMFPEARFIVMQRDAADTCLSIYFQQLGEGLRYASDLADTAHYLNAFRDLITHWQSLFADAMLEVQYERLVRDPEPELRRVCEFLGVPWDDAMLTFADTKARVRTASVWQVRRPLHADSVGRARHYARHLDPIIKAPAGG